MHIFSTTTTTTSKTTSCVSVCVFACDDQRLVSLMMILKLHLKQNMNFELIFVTQGFLIKVQRINTETPRLYQLHIRYLCAHRSGQLTQYIHIIRHNSLPNLFRCEFEVKPTFSRGKTFKLKIVTKPALANLYTNIYKHLQI